MSDDVTAWITCSGDPSVGIPDANFNVEHLALEDKADRERVRVILKRAFALITDFPTSVVFSDEFANEPEGE
jgi:hypothetical protein